MTDEERKQKIQKEFFDFVKFSTFLLDDVILKDGGKIEVYHSGYSGHHSIDFFIFHDHVRRTVGKIFIEMKGFNFKGYFYQSNREHRNVHRIEMDSLTGEEAAIKLISCFAPLINTDTLLEKMLLLFS